MMWGEDTAKEVILTGNIILYYMRSKLLVTVSNDYVYDCQLPGYFPQNVLTDLISLDFHYKFDYVRMWLQGH